MRLFASTNFKGRDTHRFGFFWILGLTVWLCHCGPEEPLTGLPQILETGELIVLTRNAPTTYYLGSETYEGFEYDLAKAFADHLGVQARFVAIDNTNDILDALAGNAGHIGAAGLTRTPERESWFLFGPDYLEVQQQVVTRRRSAQPSDIEDLESLRVAIIAGSSYEERLLQLQKEYEGLNWTATYEKETERLFQDVLDRHIDCTIADSNIVAINRRYHPELKVAFSIGEPESLAWVIAPDFEDLAEPLAEWFAEFEGSGALSQLKDQYFAYVPIFDYVDIRAFKKRIEKRLPKYEPIFREAAEAEGFEWTLLAAQAYQESHWRSRATSPTGVRGMMMLTKNTASQVGVENRLNPESSIFGGARYLRQIYDRLPESIQGQDRLYFALAAYNVGYGHLMDARRLTRNRKQDPNLWREVRKDLPLLSQKRHYRKLRYGYARGMEPVRYVQRIRNFKDILEREYNLLQPTDSL